MSLAGVGRVYVEKLNRGECIHVGLICKCTERVVELKEANATLQCERDDLKRQLAEAQAHGLKVWCDVTEARDSWKAKAEAAEADTARLVEAANKALPWLNMVGMREVETVIVGLRVAINAARSGDGE